METGATSRLKLALPHELPALLNGVPPSIRRVWLGLLLLVTAVQAAGFGFVLYDAYRLNPALHLIGIDLDFDDDSRPVVVPLRADIVAAGVQKGDRIVAVAGRRYPADASSFVLARAIMTAPGNTVRLGVRHSDGREVSVAANRSSRARAVAVPNPIPLNVRMAIRLCFTLLCSLSLLASSFVLLHRRPRDPEALLFGLAFLAIAASVDPPLFLWMSIGVDWVIDLLTAFWWTLLMVALSAFPDGRFTPHWLRWSMVVGPVLGAILWIDRLGDLPSLALAVSIPLLLLAAQVIRYRQLEPGHERQQIKWAALGFAAGFVLVGAALAASLAAYEDWSAGIRSAWLLGTVCLFNLGFAIMPLGLLVSLIRYRLWDVDRVISKSVAYSVVTSGIIVLWALLSDLAKQFVAMLVGQSHSMLGLGLGAIVATGVFVPTQRVVLRWSKRRFNPSSADLERLRDRLLAWQDRCDAPEIAARSLDIAMRALHASAGAVFARTPTGHSLLARRNSEADDAVITAPFKADGFATSRGHVLHLEDEDGLAGWMILLPRDDGSRFPRSDLDVLKGSAAPLATALRNAALPNRNATVARDLFDELQERLTRLEQGKVRPI